jgi:hypothetical protein
MTSFWDQFHHAWREAAWRAAGVWADFVDFVRVGR